MFYGGQLRTAEEAAKRHHGGDRTGDPGRAVFFYDVLATETLQGNKGRVQNLEEAQVNPKL